jgi:hypothetical protein
MAPFDTGLLWGDVYDMKQEIGGETTTPYFAAGSAAGVTSMLSVGYVLWTIRSGWLVTSVLAQMPAWRLIDPVVVLSYLDEESSEEEEALGHNSDDSLESLLENGPSADGHSDLAAEAPPSPTSVEGVSEV